MVFFFILPRGDAYFTPQRPLSRCRSGVHRLSRGAEPTARLAALGCTVLHHAHRTQSQLAGKRQATWSGESAPRRTSPKTQLLNRYRSSSDEYQKILFRRDDFFRLNRSVSNSYFKSQLAGKRQATWSAESATRRTSPETQLLNLYRSSSDGY